MYLPMSSRWKQNSTWKTTDEIENYVYSSFLCRFQLLRLGASEGVMPDWRSVLQNWADYCDVEVK